MSPTLTTVALGATAWLLLSGGAVLHAAPPPTAGAPSAAASSVKAQPQTREARSAAAPAPDSHTAATFRAVIDRYCLVCHNDRTRVADLSLEGADPGHVEADAATWEKVLVKLRAQTMPPPPRPRPDGATYAAFAAWLETAIDRAAEAVPDPGRPTVRRLNRAEYANAVRDLLAVEVDGDALLPADDMAFGFDNNADMQRLSAGLLERYLSSASRVVRLAIGELDVRPGIQSYTVPRMDAQAARASEALPFGSRGGAVIRHHFPVDGEYVVRIHSQNSVGGGVRPPSEPEQLEVRLDGVQLHRFTLQAPPPAAPGEPRRRELPPIPTVRFSATAGLHEVGVTFVERLAAPEGVAPARLPVSNVLFRGSRGAETRVGRIDIEGPFGATSLGNTPSRRRVLTCRPARPEDEAPCAREILAPLARRAYRRPVTGADLDELLTVFHAGRDEGASFELGIRWALERMLVDPDFLFRMEPDPVDAAAGAPYQLTDLQIASRLSFFLWNTIPDEELLSAAEAGRLADPAVLEQQVRRMLADPRAATLASNFAGQWLHLRNMRALAPDVNAFPEFDDNLRAAFTRETELFFEHAVHEDRSVVELLTADYTFLNERLARHYGIPGVYGSHFRRVPLSGATRRGLLGHGSMLTVTSYATRTSPVLRGKWLLENILGAPPPPPPPDVPELEERPVGESPRTMRERMEQHRANPVCAACHARMDPLGFALENFDAVGKWRATDGGSPIDASGALPDGAAFDGPAGLREMLVKRRAEVVEAVTAKLLTYALGRGVDTADMPAIRRIVREAAASDYRWSSIVLGITRSTPFQMRRAAS